MVGKRSAASLLKRTKKRRFLNDAKKGSDRGHFKRGANVEEETFNYFIRVMERLQGQFEHVEEQEVFATNVLEQTEGQELVLCCNQLVSRVIENLIPFSTDERFKKLLEGLGKDLRLVCVDQFASHIVEKTVEVAAQRAQTSKDEAYSSWVLKIGRFVSNNMEEFVPHTYANHVIRAVLTSLAGVPTETEKKKIEVPDEWKQLVSDFGNRIVKWPQLTDLVEGELTSAFLQSLLRSLHEVDTECCQVLTKILIKKCYRKKKGEAEGYIPLEAKSTSSIRTLEVIIDIADDETYMKLYKKCFKNHVLEMALHPDANFTVQKLMQRCPTKEVFELIFGELGDKLLEILESSNTGVVLKMCETAARLGCKQPAFVQCLMTALNCWEPVDNQLLICPLVLHLMKRDYWTTDSWKDKPINLHGSLILQGLLKFAKTIKFVNSLFDMSPEALCHVAEDPKGSHVFDVFMTSSYVGEKNRDKMMQKLKGNWFNLSCSKHGSRVLDCIWKTANLKQRTEIAKELAEKIEILQGNKFGRFIVSNYALELFRYRNAEWLEVVKKNKSKEKMLKEVFGDILGDVKDLKKKSSSSSSNTSNPLLDSSQYSKRKTPTDEDIDTIFPSDTHVKRKKKKDKVKTE